MGPNSDTFYRHHNQVSLVLKLWILTFLHFYFHFVVFFFWLLFVCLCSSLGLFLYLLVSLGPVCVVFVYDFCFFLDRAVFGGLIFFSYLLSLSAGHE